MRRALHLTIAFLSLACASGPEPTVQIGPDDRVVDLSLAESCDSVDPSGWLAVDDAFLTEPGTLLVRARHCAGAPVAACGAMAPEEIYPGWFNVTLVAGGAECDAPIERVVRVDLSPAPEVADPGLDRVDQRAIRGEGGTGPRVIPIWVVAR